MNDIQKCCNHFKVVMKHKLIVGRLCFKCGLIKNGLLHDMSKLSPTEFVSSARYFQGDRSPIEAEKIEKGYSLAWQHHKGHNPHHWEYWIDNVGTRKNTPIKIPTQYVIEMICDWVGAGIVYSNQKCDFNKPYAEPWNYYKAHTDERIFHEDTQKFIERCLRIIKNHGVNHFCKFAKSFKKGHDYR